MSTMTMGNLGQIKILIVELRRTYVSSLLNNFLTIVGSASFKDHLKLILYIDPINKALLIGAFQQRMMPLQNLCCNTELQSAPFCASLFKLS